GMEGRLVAAVTAQRDGAGDALGGAGPFGLVAALGAIADRPARPLAAMVGTGVGNRRLGRERSDARRAVEHVEQVAELDECRLERSVVGVRQLQVAAGESEPAARQALGEHLARAEVTRRAEIDPGVPG